jgi:hypothetical protein
MVFKLNSEKKFKYINNSILITGISILLFLLLFRPFWIVQNDSEVAHIFWQLHTIQWGLPFRSISPGLITNYIDAYIIKIFLLENIEPQLAITILRACNLIICIFFLYIIFIIYNKRNKLRLIFFSIIILILIPFLNNNITHYGSELFLFAASTFFIFSLNKEIDNNFLNKNYSYYSAIALGLACSIKITAITLLGLYLSSFIILNKKKINYLNILFFFIISIFIFILFNIILLADLIDVFSRFKNILNLKIFLILVTSYVIFNLILFKIKNKFNKNNFFILFISIFFIFFLILYLKTFIEYQNEGIIFLSLDNYFIAINTSRYIIPIIPLIFFIKIKNNFLYQKNFYSLFYKNIQIISLGLLIINIYFYHHFFKEKNELDEVIKKNYKNYENILIDENALYSSKIKFFVDGQRRYGNAATKVPLKWYDLDNISQFKIIEHNGFIKQKLFSFPNKKVETNSQENKFNFENKILKLKHSFIINFIKERKYEKNHKFIFSPLSKIQWQSRLNENFCETYKEKYINKKNLIIIDKFPFTLRNFSIYYQNNNQFQTNGLTKYAVNIEQILNSCNIPFVKINNDRFLFYNF